MGCGVSSPRRESGSRLQAGLESVLPGVCWVARDSVSASRENLLAYDFLWVTVAGGKDERETVESALIALARQCGCELQNEQNPRLESRCRATHYRSVLPRGLTVVGLPTEFSYGEQE